MSHKATPTRWRHLSIGSMLLLTLSFLARGAHADDVALCFGGSGTVEAPAPKLAADAKGVCVQFRFKAFVPPAQAMRIVSQWTDDPKAADVPGFHLDLVPGNHLAFTLRVGKGRSVSVNSKETWDLRRWHHVAAAWNSSEITLYLDGKPVGERQLDGAALAASTLPLMVGQGAAASSAAKSAEPPSFKGFVGDVAVFSAMPDAATVAQRTEKGFDKADPLLAAYLPLRQAAPGATTPESVSGQEAKLSTGLAHTGWCATSFWDQPDASPVNLHVFSYDLSAPARARSSSGDAPPALSNPVRMILLQNSRTRQFGVLWQDKADNGIYVTWIDPDFSGHSTTRLKSMPDGILAAGCTDASGNLCYVEIQKVPANRSAADPLKAVLHAASGEGKPLGELPLDTSQKALNVWNYGGRWVASMTSVNGAFALILPRTMYQSPDGLNHQGAIAIVFPPNDPAKYKNFGQITGHEFGNVLSVDSRGEFLGMDLGDCYPRGVGLHKFTNNQMVSRVVFTFKTQHSTSPRNGSPKYDEISTDGKTYYKWSNDNNTYTELGGAVEGRVSYSVIFSTDRSTAGRVLDNSRAFHGCDDPRDLAMVRIIKDFEKAPHGNEVSDAILAGGRPAGSTFETGGFFNFAGNWTKQRETGVIWLTHHKSGEAAHAPHPIRLHDGSILILWEKTSPEGRSFCATNVSEDGTLLCEAASPGSTLHLNREDAIIPANGRDFFLATDKSDNTERLCFVYEDFQIAAGGSGAGKASSAKKAGTNSK
jgi:hypothetical protein